MRYPASRVSYLHRHDRRLDFGAALEAAIPRLGDVCRNLTLYLLIAAFWGVVLYCALLAAL
jgi:hypothetical protein